MAVTSRLDVIVLRDVCHKPAKTRTHGRGDLDHNFRGTSSKSAAGGRLVDAPISDNIATATARNHREFMHYPKDLRCIEELA